MPALIKSIGLLKLSCLWPFDILRSKKRIFHMAFQPSNIRKGNEIIMKKILIPAAVISAASVLFTGCVVAGRQAPGNPAITIESAGSAVSASENAKTITVSASENVQVEPDMAELRFGVDSKAATVEEVTKINSETLDSIVSYLTGLGYEESSISTSDFSLYGDYDYSNGASTLIGYQMRTTVVLSDVAKDAVGDVLDGVLEAGANRLDGVQYYSSTYDEAYAEALDKAISLASQKAESIASSMGSEISGFVSVDESLPNDRARYSSTSGYADYGVNETAALAGGVSTSSMKVLPSEIDVSATVTVTYNVK